MVWFKRKLENVLNRTIDFDKSILLFGPRQTGKTSIVKKIPHDLYINLMDPKVLMKYESNPAALIDEIKFLSSSYQYKKPLIIIDEIQKIPNLTDAIQILIDEQIANFILTGSSARKIKNLLPGRVIKFNMFPLSMQEQNNIILDKLLVNGSLPAILNIQTQEQINLQLETYVSVYLEEEIRKEAIVRNIGAFGNFLSLACIESGNLINFSKFSQEIGVSHNTIESYYEILKDCMLITKVYPITKCNNRRRLTKAAKYLIFDLGVRRVGAMEPVNPTLKQKSNLFEQFIGLELYKLLLEKNLQSKLLFWRDHSGPKVDYVVEHEGLYVPIEVKWTDNPSQKDARHLITFSKEYNTSKNSFIICRIDMPRQIAKNIIALPWQQLPDIFKLS